MFSDQYIGGIRKERPRIRGAAPSLDPEVIEGPDFFEIIAEIHGVSDAADIDTYFEPGKRGMRIVISGSRTYELFAKLPGVDRFKHDSKARILSSHIKNGVLFLRVKIE